MLNRIGTIITAVTAALTIPATWGAPARLEPPDPNDLTPIVLNFTQASEGLEEGQFAVFDACLPSDKRRKDVETGPCKDYELLWVNRGDELSVVAYGFLYMNNKSNARVGPDGEPGSETDTRSIVSGQRIPRGALMCKTTSQSRWTFCGSFAHGVIQSEGQLQFAINEKQQSNNAGKFIVSVAINGDLYAGRMPPWANEKTDEDWYSEFCGLPDCFCTVDDIPVGEKTERTKKVCTVLADLGEKPARLAEIPPGQWDTKWQSGMNLSKSKALHPGAAYDFRWRSSDQKSGQQCIYDGVGNLITAGLGAGTPDRVGPKFPNKLTLWEFWDAVPRAVGHWWEDVFDAGILPLGAYHKRWPPNPGANCRRNIQPTFDGRPIPFGNISELQR